MYIKGRNGERMPVPFNDNYSKRLTFSAPGKPIVEKYEKPEGSNKTMLYLALILGVAVVAGTGYLLWKQHAKKQKKND